MRAAASLQSTKYLVGYPLDLGLRWHISKGGEEQDEIFKLYLSKFYQI